MIKVSYFIKIVCEYDDIVDFKKLDPCIRLDFEKGEVKVYPLGSNLRYACSTRKPKIEDLKGGNDNEN